MTSSRLKDLATAERIKAAWELTWTASRHHGTHGVDGVTPQRFRNNLEPNLTAIRRRLLSRAYEFSPLRPIPVVKKDGVSKRIICVPTIQDRVVQRAIDLYLTTPEDKLGVINTVSYGFVGGQQKGVFAARNRAIHLRTEHPWAYKSDIVSFFDNIPRPDLIERLNRRMRSPSLRWLFDRVVACEIKNVEPGLQRAIKAAGIVRGTGLRQGMPLSPLFSNVILGDFDRRLESAGLSLVRYADDFVVFADSKAQCLEVDRLVREELGKLGLKIPEIAAGSKTQITPPGEEIEFLGLGLSPTSEGRYALRVTPKQINTIKASFDEMKDFGRLSKKSVRIGGFIESLRSRVRSYSYAYEVATNIDQVRNMLNDKFRDVVHSVLCQIFGSNALAAMKASHRAFFELKENILS